MRIPYTINKNTYSTYVYNNKSDIPNKLISNNFKNWDDSVPKTLREFCLFTIAEHWIEYSLFDEIPLSIDKCLLVDMLPTNLPLQLTVLKINDDAYWKRCYNTRFPKNPPLINPDEHFDASILKTPSNSLSSHNSIENGTEKNKEKLLTRINSISLESAEYFGHQNLTWKKCYLEMHLKEVLENMEPENYDPEKIKELSDLCRPYVTVLKLKQLRAPQNVADHIPLTAILIGLPHLREFSLCFKQTYIGDKFSWHIFQTTLHDTQTLSKGLEKCNLTVLRIQNSDLDCEKILILLKAILKSETLKTIDFSNCKISNKGAIGFSKFLLKNSILENLILANNKIREKGAQALAYALHHPDCMLNSLNLRLNFIGLEGGKSIMEALINGAKKLHTLCLSACRLKQNPFISKMISQNKTLRNLDISNNRIGEDIGKDIMEALDKNLTLDKLDVRMCNLTSETEHAIYKKITKNKSFAKEKPFSRLQYTMEDLVVDESENIEASAELMSEINKIFEGV